jgi:hypothetical protein
VHFPEFLYQLSSRDQQVTWLDPVFFRATEGTAGLTPSTAPFRVPLGKVLMLTNVNITGIPGAGQAVTRMFAVIISPAGTAQRSIMSFRTVLAADIESHHNWSGEIIVPSEWRLQAIGNFNLAVAVNEVTFDFCGILLPVGNVQRV